MSFGDIFGSTPDYSAAFTKKPQPKNLTPMPQIRGKQIDDVLYVRASDVADALEVLSATTNKRLIDKLRGAQP